MANPHFIDWAASKTYWESIYFLTDEELIALDLPFLSNPENYPDYVLAIPPPEKETQETVHG